METKQTTLQRIILQKREQIIDAIKRAIDEGAEIEFSPYGVKVDGVFFVISMEPCLSASLVIDVTSNRIEGLIISSPERLRERRKVLEKELEQINELINEQ